MKLKSFLLPVGLFLGVNVVVFGQEFCGTVISVKQKVLETPLSIVDATPNVSLLQVKRTISITVYVVKEEFAPYFNASPLNSTIDMLNVAFLPIALNFKICDIKTISNYQFDNLSIGGNEADLVTQNSDPGTINLYLVSKLFDSGSKQISGFSYMPGDAGKHAIFLKKGAIGGTELIHQIGHFFNLYHTHESDAFGAEYVNKTNCTLAGDRVCDTNADPNVSLYMKNGVYIGLVKDANKDLYSPSPKNIMSFGPDASRCFFSRIQFLRMIYALQNFRTNLH